MVRANDVRQLSDFRANAAAHLDRLAETGAIEVLTVDGEPRGVVMAPHVFDEMTERLEKLEATASIQRSLADAAAGRTRPARASIEKLASELALDLKSSAE